MSAPTADQPERLACTARTMAILCAFLGPVMAGTTVATLLLVKLVDVVEAQAGSASAIPPWFDPLVAFSADSAPLMLGLGLLFTAAGGYAWARPVRGLGPLRWTAWIGVVAMLALGGVWWWSARGHGMGAAWIGSGIGAHVVQAALIFGAARFLGRADVRAAVAARA